MLMEDIRQQLHQAQLSRDQLKVSALRMLLSELTNAQIAKGQQLSGEEINLIIQKEVKKRQEAADSFRLGKREDKALKEEQEAAILTAFLPPQLSNEELTKIITDIINEIGVSGIQDMGRVMGAVMVKVAGRADGGTVSKLVKEKLNQ